MDGGRQSAVPEARTHHEQRGSARRLFDRQLMAQAQIASLATAALEQLGRGVVLVGKAGQVYHANRLAREICAAGDGLALCEGRLTGTQSPDAARLAAALRRAQYGGATELLRLARPSGRRPLSVLVTAMGPTRGIAAQPQRDGGAVVWICMPERIDAPACSRLMQSYGLTAAEAGLLHLLLSGCDLAGSSRQLGISVTTARTHLRSVLAKTGTHRQSELVRLSLHEVGGIS